MVTLNRTKRYKGDRKQKGVILLGLGIRKIYIHITEDNNLSPTEISDWLHKLYIYSPKGSKCKFMTDLRAALTVLYIQDKC